eukprot:gnl/MRDRNA2_/MRDRNA2_86717_c0_seq1.p3 gnl/MRDRNA2_/MRDRNA2_86717_c0~~gnl/MRDRNA2_/MRDRNA2_86717_c0_seq1.p3  ORF type:complete len:408 (+),score=33.06 gnl/MRDRNA2_/MRDRNA2_86717_c0_seq1:4062-5285(+)
MDLKIMFSNARNRSKEIKKIDYNSLPLPKGYVAGLGRGVTGFVTRSDIGPGTYAPGEDGNDSGEKQNANVDDDTPCDFIGSDAGIFAQTGAYEEDDREADVVWDAVDEFINQRRPMLETSCNGKRMKITQYFQGLKREMRQMSYEDWEAIPIVEDYTLKRTRHHQSNPKTSNNKLYNNFQGKDLPLTNEYKSPTLTAPGDKRGTVITYKLDRAADSVTGQTVLDPKGYITELKSIKIDTDSELLDIKKARLLLKSLTHTNSKHGPGWIAAARLEEVAGRLYSAKNLIMRGLNKCVNNEDVWLEAIRLQSAPNSKNLLIKGVAQIPNSIKLWLLAANLEKNRTSKLNIILKALEHNSNSVRLWKAAVELAEENEARTLLSQAVEKIPQQIELWLALAKLETYENAKKF